MTPTNMTAAITPTTTLPAAIAIHFILGSFVSITLVCVGWLVRSHVNSVSYPAPQDLGEILIADEQVPDNFRAIRR